MSSHPYIEKMTNIVTIEINQGIVNRDIPIILKRKMKETRWTNFFDKIDAVGISFRRIHLSALVVVPLSFILFVGLFFLGIESLLNVEEEPAETTEPLVSEGVQDEGYTLISIASLGFMIMLLGFYFLLFNQIYCRTKIAIQSICKNQSLKHPALDFQLKEPMGLDSNRLHFRWLIEVKVDQIYREKQPGSSTSSLASDFTETSHVSSRLEV